MKFYQILLFLFVLNTCAQTQNQTNALEITSADLDKKIEDKNGKLITDRTEKINYFKNRQKQIELLKKNSSFSKILTPVYLCSNGTFEEFETVSGTNFLNDFLYAEDGLLNPVQCRNLDATANIRIPQYNPTNLSIMATTVPSNFLDDYIGNINAFDQFALKINYKDSYESASLVQAKRFKTNNENSLKFNYKAVLQSIPGNDHEDEQPFFKARIVNNAGVVVSEFCLIADTQNCIFTQAPTLEGGSIVLFTPNWQSGILDISSIPNNEPFTVEFSASRCGLRGHFGYAYVDDICLLHSNENLQGSIELDPLNKICPTLPIAVCGSFTIPTSGGISATITSIVLTVKDASNTIVYTTPITSSLDLITKRFCFNLSAANLPNITIGSYNVGVAINYGITQTNCAGTNFASARDDDANPGWDIWFLNCTNCPVNVQTASLSLCDTNKDGKEFFNLPNVNSLIITPTTGLTFTYFTNLNDATNNTNPIAGFLNYESYSTTLFVRITQSATCYKIIPIELIVKNPHATISGILNVCFGSTVLNASSGTSYLWNTGATTQSITVNTVGTYSVTVVDSNGCSSIGSVTILANQVAPQPTIQIIQPTCTTTTGSITITSPASQYSFDNGTTWGTSPSMGNLAIGSYQIKIITASGCNSYAANVSIVPFQSSFPIFSQVDPTFCGGKGSITITTLADFYSFDDGITWTTNNTATNLPSGTYNIRTKDNAGCISNYNSVSLFSEFLNPPLFTKNNPYCGNLGSITIDTPASEYSFDGGTTWQTSNTLSNLSNGSYILKIRDAQGCTSPTVYVYLNDLESSYPEYTIDEAGCGKYATITITTPGDLYSFDGGTTWTTTNILSNLSGGTSYDLMVKKNPNCTSYSNYIYLNNIFLPLPTPNDYTTTECDDLNDGTEAIDLNNYTTNLISNSTNYTFEFYTSLLGAENQLFASQITNSSSYSMSNTNNIVYVRVIAANGCHKVVELKIYFINSPVIHMENNYPLCVDKYVVIYAGVGYASYLWSTGQTTEHITITQPGNYWVTVTENHAAGLVCSSTKNFTIFLSNFATISSIETFDWTDNENVIIANATGIGVWEYSLDGIHFQDNNTFTNLTVGTYTVFIRDKNGCGIVAKEVFLLNYPRFFTPNNDGINDAWKVKFSQYEPGIKVEIFDRNGKLLKILDNTNSWDGVYNGNLLPSDDYWFVVHRVNGLTHKGHFAMKR
jgi:gliding motility-associated-like protein